MKGTSTAFLYTNDNQPGKNDLIYSRKESYSITGNKFMTEEIQHACNESVGSI